MATTEQDLLAGRVNILGPTDKDIERFEQIHGHKPDVDESVLVETVQGWWDEQDSAMWERFHRWVYNIRFTDGEQWLTSLDGRAWFEPPTPDGVVRVTNNLTRRAMEYRISKLTESRSVGKITPHSNEVDDADRAEVGQQLALHLDRWLDMGAVYEEGLWFDSTCGTSFLYIGWERETGELVVAKKAKLGLDGQSVAEYYCDANGNEVESADNAFSYMTGDVSVEVVPPWCMRVGDPQQTDPRRQRRWMWGSILEVSEIKRMFGAKANDISGGAEYDQYTYMEDLVSSWSTSTYRKRPREKPFEPRALLLRVFERPSTEFPDGRYLVVCEKTLLFSGPLPYGDIPFVQLRTSFRAKDFYGKPPVEDLIPIQKRINQLESHAIEYIRLFAKGGISAEYGTVIEETAHDTYGNILYYSGDQPSPMSWPGMPSDVWEALNRAYENFDRISGWADVARGDVPPGVKAAKAILELKRSNDTPLGKGLERFDRCVEKVTAKMIERARWGYNEPHWIQITGSDVPHMVKSITRDNLPMKFSVKIESDSMLRLSYPAKLELLFELADRQWVSPASAMRLLNFADWDHMSGQWNRDYSRARMKIEMLTGGIPVDVQWWEDDAVHMLALEERMKDPRFESLDPAMKVALSNLWLSHYRQSQMKQMGVMPELIGAIMPQQPGLAPAIPPGQMGTPGAEAALSGMGGQPQQQQIPFGQPQQQGPGGYEKEKNSNLQNL